MPNPFQDGLGTLFSLMTINAVVFAVPATAFLAGCLGILIAFALFADWLEKSRNR